MDNVGPCWTGAPADYKSQQTMRQSGAPFRRGLRSHSTLRSHCNFIDKGDDVKGLQLDVFSCNRVTLAKIKTFFFFKFPGN